ncbi:hypothetical protein [Pedobacter sp.]|uniref:hypothetical protein n=1 Tax=Pedobacter sp. TaxID=1411316 RepID=UPI0031CEB86F
MKTMSFKGTFSTKGTIARRTFSSALSVAYFLIIALCLSACSKDEGGDVAAGDFYLRATVGRKEVNFHNVNFQGGGNDSRFEHIVVGGYETSYPLSGPIPPSLDFEIWRLGGNITAGTYATPAENKMIARYAIQKPEGTLLYNTSFADDVFTLKIEAISKSGIKGTFSGTVRNMAGEAISITDGTFNLPYQTVINP